jgi:hypothetical protein
VLLAVPSYVLLVDTGASYMCMDLCVLQGVQIAIQILKLSLTRLKFAHAGRVYLEGQL